jgi:hypothetical protein
MPLDGNSGVSPSVASGTYTGTTAAQTITVGFRPSWAMLMNQTDGDVVFIWHNSVTTTGISIDTEAATETVTITATDHGLSLPTNAVVNENAKVYVFIAGR